MKKGVVCSAQLRKELFTSGALVDLDHNLTSSTATDSFHGTGISIFQSPTKSNAPPGRNKSRLPGSKEKNCVT